MCGRYRWVYLQELLEPPEILDADEPDAWFELQIPEGSQRAATVYGKFKCRAVTATFASLEPVRGDVNHWYAVESTVTMLYDHERHAIPDTLITISALEVADDRGNSFIQLEWMEEGCGHAAASTIMIGKKEPAGEVRESLSSRERRDFGLGVDDEVVEHTGRTLIAKAEE